MAPALRRVTDYARRRLLRILPAYWLVLVVLIVLPGFTGACRGPAGSSSSRCFTRCRSATAAACIEAVADCGLAQTWSLVVEFSFYAVLPLYAIAAGRPRPRPVGDAAWLRAELLLLAGSRSARCCSTS